MNLRDAYAALGMPLTRYAWSIGLPIVGSGLVLGLVLQRIAGTYLPFGLEAVITPLFVIASLAAAVLWPFVRAEQRRQQIDDALPFFLTHFGVLGTSNMQRSEIIGVLGQRKAYRALAAEMQRIEHLVREWNLSLPEAARTVGKTTPSQLLSDFLERLANALESGQSMEDFLGAEQSVVLQEYAALYERGVQQVEAWKETYSSALMTTSFFAVFALIMPVLVGGDPQRLLFIVLGLTGFQVFLLGFVLKARLPADRLLLRRVGAWHRALPALGPVLGILVAAVMFSRGFAVPWALAAGAVPLALGGFLAHRDEETVKRREAYYAAFVRSLGSSVQARGGSVRDVLGQIRQQEFGPLGPMVERLHNRLRWNQDDAKAWKHFGHEAGSHIIDAFTDMFVEGMQAGGKPGAIGVLISENMVSMLNLRATRYSSAASFRSMLLGLTGGLALVLFVGVVILASMDDMFNSSFDRADLPLDLSLEYQPEVVDGILFALLTMHAVSGALLAKMMDGGRLLASGRLAALLLWLGLGVAVLTQRYVPGFIG